jgi:hypothetical protein
VIEPDGQKSHWAKSGPEVERSCGRRCR